MRLMVSLGLIAFGLCACARLPQVVRVEVGGSTVEFKKKPDAAPDAPLSNASAGDEAPR